MYWFIGLLVYISPVLTYLLGTVSHVLWPWATRLAEENDQHFSDFLQLGNPTRTKDSRESARRDSAKVYLFVTGEAVVDIWGSWNIMLCWKVNTVNVLNKWFIILLYIIDVLFISLSNWVVNTSYDVIIWKLSLSLQCTRTPVASDLEATFQQLRRGWLRTDTNADVQAQTNDEQMLRHSIKHMLK